MDLSTRESEKLRELERALKASSFPDQVKEEVLSALVRAVGEFRTRPENRDRRIKKGPLDFIVKTLGRVVLAVVDSDEHLDGNVRRDARKSVRACRHLPLEEIAETLSRLRGQKNASGHRRKNEAIRKRARRHRIDENTELVQICTSDDLASVGRKNDLCVGHPRSPDGKPYHDALRAGKSEFSELERNRKFLAHIEVDSGSREVLEISGPGNRPVWFSRSVGLGVLSALDATADRVPEFARVGAFSPYLSEEKPVAVAKLVVKECQYSFDAFPGQQMLVVVEARKGKRGLILGRTLFRRETNVRRSPLARWCRASARRNALSEGQLLEIMFRCPELADVVHGVWPTSSKL